MTNSPPRKVDRNMADRELLICSVESGARTTGDRYE